MEGNNKRKNPKKRHPKKKGVEKKELVGGYKIEKDILKDSERYIKIVPEGNAYETILKESGIGLPPKISCVIC